MLTAILIVCAALALAILAALIIAALRPADFRIARSATIAAPPAAVFAQVNDFHNWNNWSPWAKLDPAAQNTFEGAPSGTGAIFSWAGNKKVGQGRMTITDSRPAELIRIKLEFFKPFAATNTAEFTFQTQGAQTLTTWTMTGQNKFLGRLFCLFMNMDKMLGREFDKGLAQIKALAESATQP